MYFCIVAPPSCSPTSAHTVLTEFVSASVSVIGPKSSAEVVQRHARDDLAVAAAHRAVRGVAPGVDRGQRGDDLERRARWIAGLRHAVQQRRVRVGVQAAEEAARGQLPGVEARVRGEGLDRARARVERDDRALAGGQAVERRALGARVERRAQVVAVGRRREHLVQQRAELAAVAHERLVVLLLQPGAAEADVAVADRVGEQPAGRVPARVGPVGALERPGEHRAVRGADRPAADPLLGEDLALVAGVGLQVLGAEDGVVGRLGHERGEEQQDHDEQAGDGHVHRAYSRRARSDTMSSSASRTKFATIDEPP